MRAAKRSLGSDLLLWQRCVDLGCPKALHTRLSDALNLSSVRATALRLVEALVSPGEFLQNGVVQDLIGQQLLKPGILFFEKL